MKMNKSKQIISNYLKNVAKNLQVSRILKSTFIHELKDSVTSFVSENKNITIDDLYNEFGTPEEISEGFLDRKDFATLLKKSQITSFRLRIICICSVILCIIIFIFLIWVIHESSGTITVTDAYHA